MNQTNFDRIVERYIEDFDFLNQEERYKWVAVKQFQDHWDIEADDFVDMYRRSFSKIENLIGTRIRPDNGMRLLAEQPELTEQVRDMFCDLFQNDGGDLVARHERIIAFGDQVKPLLDEYHPGKFSYKHTYRDILIYLNLRYPDDNFFYKSTEIKPFIHCVEFGESIGSGWDFNLPAYYRLGQEVVKAIKDKPELLELHQSRLTPDMHPDKALHMLAYDVMFATGRGNYCEDLTYDLPKRASKPSSKYLASLKEEESLQAIKQAEAKLHEKESELDEIEELSLLDVKVESKAFGKGVVTEHSDNRLVIAFGDQTKRFELPQAFTEGFLKTDSDEVHELYQQMADLTEEIKHLKTEVRRKQLNLK